MSQLRFIGSEGIVPGLPHTLCPQMTTDYTPPTPAANVRCSSCDCFGARSACVKRLHVAVAIAVGRRPEAVTSMRAAAAAAATLHSTRRLEAQGG